MSAWRKLLRALVRTPAGFPTDGRVVGMATVVAVERHRDQLKAEAIRRGRRQATATATESNQRHLSGA